MTQTQLCPCGSDQSLSTCCLPFIQGKAEPKIAEELLRARYTAFTTGDVDYIVKTHHSKTSKDVSRKDIADWSKNSEWVSLKILHSEKGGAGDTEGKIAFHATYRAKGQMTDHYELSQFEKEGGKWRFLDAQALKPQPIRRDEPKVGRNDPCTCGSGKKYKKCHGLNAATAD